MNANQNSITKHYPVTARCPECNGDNIGHVARAFVTTPVQSFFMDADGNLNARAKPSWQAPTVEKDHDSTCEFEWACMDCGNELMRDDLVISTQVGIDRLVGLVLWDTDQVSKRLNTAAAAASGDDAMTTSDLIICKRIVDGLNRLPVSLRALEAARAFVDNFKSNKKFGDEARDVSEKIRIALNTVVSAQSLYDIDNTLDCDIPL